jgi:DNA-directed RNA polymerase specialized sigma24 family protein
VASERETLVDAFTRVRIALDHPDLTSNERAALQMTYVQGWDDDDARDCLCMTQREYRKTRADALEKASAIVKKPVPKAAPDQMECDA